MSQQWSQLPAHEEYTGRVQALKKSHGKRWRRSRVDKDRKTAQIRRAQTGQAMLYIGVCSVIGSPGQPFHRSHVQQYPEPSKRWPHPSGRWENMSLTAESFSSTHKRGKPEQGRCPYVRTGKRLSSTLLIAPGCLITLFKKGHYKEVFLLCQWFRL